MYKKFFSILILYMEKIENWDDKNFFKNEKYENFSAIICDSRRSGKSYLLKYLLKIRYFKGKKTINNFL